MNRKNIDAVIAQFKKDYPRSNKATKEEKNEILSIKVWMVAQATSEKDEEKIKKYVKKKTGYYI